MKSLFSVKCAVAACAIIGAISGPVGAQPAAQHAPLEGIGVYTVCFTPGNNSTEGADCAALAVATIGGAMRTLDVQAYNFTEPRIGAAIVAAKQRGIAVRLIVDKISAHQKGEQVDLVAGAGIPVSVDVKPRIAHNKVMVIDGQVLITGSFNFSVSAQRANAENLLVVRDAALAGAYEADFERRLAVSVPYQPGGGQ